MRAEGRGDEVVARSTRIEVPLFGLFLACWVLAVVHNLGLLTLSANLDLTLYQLYGGAAAIGWVAGNVYVNRRRRLPQEHKRRALALWLVGPQGIPALLRAMAPPESQAAAPAVPLYAFGVGAVFFCVPLVFGRR